LSEKNRDNSNEKKSGVEQKQESLIRFV